MDIPQSAKRAPASRRDLLEQRLVWLTGALERLQRESQRSAWLLLTAFLAIPAGYFGGRWAAVFALGVSVSLWLVGLYVTWTHRNEYQGEVDAIQRQLEDMDRS